LQTREWTDKNGNKRLAYEINVNKADFCGSRRDNEQNYTEYPGAGNDNPFIDGGDGDGDLPF
jgi:single-stranded DNA-binding protein